MVYVVNKDMLALSTRDPLARIELTGFVRHKGAFRVSRRIPTRRTSLEEESVHPRQNLVDPHQGRASPERERVIEYI